jgi:hypothetical protein
VTKWNTNGVAALALLFAACSDDRSYNERAVDKEREWNKDSSKPNCADPFEWPGAMPQIGLGFTYCVDPCVKMPGVNPEATPEGMTCCFTGQRCDPTRWIEIDGVFGVCIASIEGKGDTIVWQSCMELDENGTSK